MAKEKKTGFDKVFKVLSADPEIHVGFSDINLWADTGIYALNYRLTGDYKRAFLYGTQVGFYGESMSGKSLLFAQTASNEQRDRGAFIVWIDVEGAESDKTEGLRWFHRAGINTEENFERLFVPSFRKALKTMTQFVGMYREADSNGTLADLPPLIIVFDSYSMLQTDSMIEQNLGKKDLTGDQGQKAKQLADFVGRSRGMLEGLPILMGGVMHVYMSQDQYGPRHLITGGMRPMNTARVALKASRFDLTNENASHHLKQSETTDDKKDNIGIRAAIDIMKCHYNKPGERVMLEAVYGQGFDKYSGLWDLFIERDLITSPSQGWYQFTREDGIVKKFQKRNFLEYADELMKIPLKDKYISYKPPTGEVDIYDPDVEDEVIVEAE